MCVGVVEAFLCGECGVCGCLVPLSLADVIRDVASVTGHPPWQRGQVIPGAVGICQAFV